MLSKNTHTFYLPLVIKESPRFSVNTWPRTNLEMVMGLNPEYVRLNSAEWHHGFEPWNLESLWAQDLKAYTQAIQARGGKVWLVLQGFPEAYTDGRPCWLEDQYFPEFRTFIYATDQYFQVERLQILNEVDAPAVHPYFGCGWPVEKYNMLLQGIDKNLLHAELFASALYDYKGKFLDGLNVEVEGYSVNLYAFWDGVTSWKPKLDLEHVRTRFRDLGLEPVEISEINLLCSFGARCDSLGFWEAQAQFLREVREAWEGIPTVYAATGCGLTHAWYWACLWFPDLGYNEAGKMIAGVNP